MRRRVAGGMPLSQLRRQCVPEPVHLCSHAPHPPCCHAGLGTVAARSLQAEFDDAVAVLKLATDALATSRQQLAAVAAAAEGEGPAEAALAAVRGALAGCASADPSGDLLVALQARLAEWQQRVVSYQDPSRLLRWTSGKSGGSTAAAESERSGTPS